MRERRARLRLACRSAPARSPRSRSSTVLAPVRWKTASSPSLAGSAARSPAPSEKTSSSMSTGRGGRRWRRPSVARCSRTWKASDHAEEARPRAAGRPQQTRRALGVGAHQLAGGGDDVDRLDAHARRAVDAPVPAVPALQQIAAEPDPRAVPGGEEQPVGGRARASSSSPGRRAGPARASRPDRPRPRRAARRRAASRRRGQWLPAQLCPPARTPMRIPSRRALVTAATTSSASSACTTRSGNRSGARPFHTARAGRPRIPPRRDGAPCLSALSAPRSASGTRARSPRPRRGAL